MTTENTSEVIEQTLENKVEKTLQNTKVSSKKSPITKKIRVPKKPTFKFAEIFSKLQNENGWQIVPPSPPAVDPNDPNKVIAPKDGTIIKHPAKELYLTLLTCKVGRKVKKSTDKGDSLQSKIFRFNRSKRYHYDLNGVIVDNILAVDLR